ncbi:hypothetical protein LMG32289_06257 [Cupriavidus pampae]|uniref:Uncharacterized protein n=1 Tax=Cupriavidus pampae TaxID=659251 RepID=A0ABM8Y062_9BURK|nr:hypothetical protein LMG32289_06257 [Cupriavidus pampae]
MDIQEIARLHTRYAEPPLTIDMPGSGNGGLQLEHKVEAPGAEATTAWRRLAEWQRQVIAVLVVAAVAFPIGMWTASGGKHDAPAAAPKAPSADVSRSAPANADSAQGHEWPAKSTAPTPTAGLNEWDAQSAVPASGVAGAAVAHPAPAGPAVSQGAASSVAPVPPLAKAPVKAPAQTAQSPRSAVPQAPAAQPSHASEPRRNNEIKLF